MLIVQQESEIPCRPSVLADITKILDWPYKLSHKLLTFLLMLLNTRLLLHPMASCTGLFLVAPNPISTTHLCRTLPSQRPLCVFVSQKNHLFYKQKAEYCDIFLKRMGLLFWKTSLAEETRNYLTYSFVLQTTGAGINQLLSSQKIVLFFKHILVCVKTGFKKAQFQDISMLIFKG